MFNVGSGEIILIAVVALLVLGPSRLPEFARGIGKFIREFRRQTDDVRQVVEREFYRMDQDVSEPGPFLATPDGIAARDQREAAHDEHGQLAPSDGTTSQVTAGMPAAPALPPAEPAAPPAPTVATANAPPADAPAKDPEKPA